jgi:hypothetical protein
MTRGRPKGHSPYIEISYEELGDWVGRKSKVVVSKKWLDSITDNDYVSPIQEIKSSEVVVETKDIPKIEYTLTEF